jgi:DNA-directed RNA polymerase subunit RPC12/RpoP
MKGGEVNMAEQKEFYCVKCKAKVTADATPITMKNGRPANKGVCPDCGTGVFRIGK